MNRRHPLYIVGFMVAVAAAFGAAVTGLRLGTAEVLRRNQALLREKALVAVFDLGDPQALSKAEIHRLVTAQVRVAGRVRDPVTGWETELLTAGDAAGAAPPRAYAFAFRGLGFWAPIEGLLALTPDLERSVGLVIVQHSETPGLGGRIAEPLFTEQFRRGLDLRPGAEPQRTLVLAATPPPPGSPLAGRTLEAISGATQTCMAMERILNEQLAAFRRAMAAGVATPQPPAQGR
jgi:Na+-transporting NADH:ubiquinone oxidoreductase subunit C